MLASPEAEFWDIIGTKVFKVFLFAMHSHLYIPPPPLSKSGLKLACNVNMLFHMETSGLRTLKIMLKNLNEIVCSLFMYSASERHFYHVIQYWAQCFKKFPNEKNCFQNKVFPVSKSFFLTKRSFYRTCREINRHLTYKSKLDCKIEKKSSNL